MACEKRFLKTDLVLERFVHLFDFLLSLSLLLLLKRPDWSQTEVTRQVGWLGRGTASRIYAHVGPAIMLSHPYKREFC